MSTPETLTRELAALDDALAGRPVDPDLADLAELAALVRDERPVPDPAFASSLDERAKRGFPRAAKRRLPVFSWPKITLPALGLAASVFLVVADRDVGARRRHHRPGRQRRQRRRRLGRHRGGALLGFGRLRLELVRLRLPRFRGPQGRAVAPGTPSASPRPRRSRPRSPSRRGPAARNADGRDRRYVERSAQIVIATPPRDIDRAAAKIIKVADDLGGFVVSSQVSSGSSGEFELRVPERRLQRALSQLSAVGKVRERTQASQDVTGAVVSVQERLKDARTERRSLLRQLGKATTVNQTTSIRERLRLVSGQIASAKRDLRSVKRRASYSTIGVQLLADRRAGSSAGDDDDASGWTPGDALKDAARILEVSAGVLLVAAALALPVGLVALLVWLAMRQAAQRRRERALDAV